ncbi:hypothetical protein [Nocardia arthritidis]|uniref:Conjugal transfer protein TrbC n=1 Tax=Nocardia arthritidis TaxID=228602 RepID=A0A6G9Y6W1_9NOCA|nr:hypothetical protein [Nocardia arthritidis]QIS08793.1 hypothetical protein F5544_04395 [Nocardia arthritidis]
MSTFMLAQSAVSYLADTIQVVPTAPPGSNGLLKIIGWLSWAAMAAGVAGIIFAGGKFAWERWHGGAMESPKIVFGALVGGILITFAGSIMNEVVS